MCLPLYFGNVKCCCQKRYYYIIVLNFDQFDTWNKLTNKENKCKLLRSDLLLVIGIFSASSTIKVNDTRNEQMPMIMHIDEMNLVMN